MSEKIKILLVPSDIAGVGHYRNIWPGQEINKKFSDTFSVDIDHSPNFNDIEYFKQYNIIHFHRQLGHFDKQQQLITALKANNIIVVMDLDDYWLPPKEHPMYGAAVNEKLPEKIIATFKMVDYVTTTTDIFASHIKKYNKNVFVIPNAIDVGHQMWSSINNKIESDKVRVSWIGGSSHAKDLDLLRPSMNMLHNDHNIANQYQIVMCGYDVRGFVTEVDNAGRPVNHRKIHPHETIWNEFEKIFTDNYNTNIISEEYKKYLLKYQNIQFKDDVYNTSYVRRWTLPLTQYGKHYNYCDVCLAPLAENTFNEVKSELKIIEAGLTKKVLIAQDYGIYKKLIVNGENGILIPKSNNTRGWYEAIKKVVTDKEYREKLSTNLYNFVTERYTLEIVTKTRADWYQNIYLNQQNEKNSILEGIVSQNI